MSGAYSASFAGGWRADQIVNDALDIAGALTMREEMAELLVSAIKAARSRRYELATLYLTIVRAMA